MSTIASMPRVTHVISTPEGLGGAERVLGALVEEGARRRWSQRVLNPFARDPGSAELLSVCPDGIYRGSRCARIAEVPRLRRWLSGEIDSFAPDLVHAHLFHASVTVASLRRPAGACRVMSHHHGNKLLVDGSRPMVLLDQLSGTRYDRVVAVSKWTREFLLSRYRYAPARVDCIPNGWSGTPLRSPPPPPEPTVVCVARLRAQKGHAVLLAAFRRVLEHLPSARLILVGGGELHHSVESEISRLGMDGSVSLEGSVRDVWPFLARSHVFALASHYEPLGISILEAMAAGLPVVATAVGGVPDIVSPGVTGALVCDRDAPAMADRLVELLKSPGLRDQMGEAAKRAAAGMTMDVTVERHFALYEHLLASRKGRL